MISRNPNAYRSGNALVPHASRKTAAAALRRGVADGRWSADPVARSDGRGAYLCSPQCVERVKKNKKYKGPGDGGHPAHRLARYDERKRVVAAVAAGHMAGVRVHELAKELNLSSQETIALLSKVGISASTHMSLIDEHRARIVKGVLTGNLAEEAKRVKIAPKKSAPATGNGAAAAQAVAPAPAAQAETVVAATQVAEAPSAPVVPEEPIARLRVVPPAQKQPRPAPRPAPQPKVIPAASADPTAPIPTLRPAAQAGTVAPPRPPQRPLGGNLRPVRSRSAGRGVGPRPGFSRPGGPGPGRPGGPGGPGRGMVQSGPMPSAPPSGGRKKSREELERDRKERERESLLKKQQPRSRAAQVGATVTEPEVLKDLPIPDLITVQQLAAAMETPAGQVIAQLIRMGTMATINQHITPDVASQVARRFGFNIDRQGSWRRSRAGDRRRGGSAGFAHDAAAGRHRARPRRPWQDVAARRHPFHQGGRGRSGRHHAAHRRLHG